MYNVMTQISATKAICNHRKSRSRRTSGRGTFASRKINRVQVLSVATSEHCDSGQNKYIVLRKALVLTLCKFNGCGHKNSFENVTDIPFRNKLKLEAFRAMISNVAD